MANLTPHEGESPSARVIDRGRALSRLGRRQHGVVARRQLYSLGFDRGAIDWRLRSGSLSAVHRGVYALGPGPLTRNGRWSAAVLAYGDHSVLSYASAAALWGLARPGNPTDVTAPEGRSGRRGIRLHRSRVEPDERTRHNRIATTNVARTLLDLAQTCDESRLRATWQEADRLGLLEVSSVERIRRRLGSRRGVRAVRALIEESLWQPPTRSPLEDRLVALCRDQGLPAPLTNVEILGFEVDAFWPAARLVVEADGFEFHGHRAAFERDRARDAALVSAGFRVLRITHRRLDREAVAVAEQLQALIARGWPRARG